MAGMHQGSNVGALMLELGEQVGDSLVTIAPSWQLALL
jgi:hypothetical protein